MIRQELPNSTVLVVVTVGGASNVAPILHVCEILAGRGHRIEFATLQGRQHLVDTFPFVSDVHVIGRAITAEEEKQFYERLNNWSGNTIAGRRIIVATKKFNDSFWAETYRNLSQLVEQKRPDLLFADYQITDAVRDVALRFQVALAVMWCQMPWMMAPQPWVPGQPGMQHRCLTSEHASMIDRLYDGTFVLRGLPTFLSYFLWYAKLRKQSGVPRLPSFPKPDHLLLINSFWGLEPAKDLPPLMCPVGPILSDSYDILDEACESFLRLHTRVVYVAFGGHVLMPKDRVERIVQGLSMAMTLGRIDGVIWSFRSPPPMECISPVSAETALSYIELFDNKSPHWLFLPYAPQRAVLDSPSTKLFLSHAGPSSVNEAIYHGIPMITMPIYGDQLQNSMRVREAGNGVEIEKGTFTAGELTDLVSRTLEDANGEIGRNVQRMQIIAIIASRRKMLAADLIEELLADWHLRFSDSSKEDSTNGRELRPMHLQTADARMSWMKRKNMDLRLLFVGVLLVVLTVLTFGIVWAVLH